MVLLLALACSTAPPRERIAEPDSAALFSFTGAGPAVVVGLGAEAHEDALPGDPAVMVFGGQGGFHVDVSGRVRGLGELVALELSVAVDGATIAVQGDFPTNLKLLPAADPGEYVFAAQRAYLLDNSLVAVCGWRGAAAVVCARASSLLDPSVAASDCVDVVLQMEPANLYMCG